MTEKRQTIQEAENEPKKAWRADRSEPETFVTLPPGPPSRGVFDQTTFRPKHVGINCCIKNRVIRNWIFYHLGRRFLLFLQRLHHFSRIFLLDIRAKHNFHPEQPKKRFWPKIIMCVHYSRSPGPRVRTPYPIHPTPTDDLSKVFWSETPWATPSRRSVCVDRRFVSADFVAVMSSSEKKRERERERKKGGARLVFQSG